MCEHRALHARAADLVPFCSKAEQNISKYLDKWKKVWYNPFVSILKERKTNYNSHFADLREENDLETNHTYVPRNFKPKPGVRYTPPEEREAVVIYRSMMDTVHDTETPEEGNAILRDLLDCSFGFEVLENVERPHRLIIRGMLVDIDHASRRYDEACANGKRGGRPKTEVDLEQVERLRTELGSYEKAAQQLGSSVSTLYRARQAQQSDRSIGQNLTDKDTKTKTNTFTTTYTKTTRAPDAEAQQRAREEDFERKRRQALERLEAHGLENGYGTAQS